MRALTTWLTLCTLIMAGSAAWAADPALTSEFTTDAQGNLMTRIIAPGSPGIPVNGVGPVVRETDQEVLWMTEDPIAIAQNVDIYGNGEGIVVGWWLNSMRTAKYATQGTGTPIWEYPQAVSFFLPVSCSDDGNTIASTGSQIPLSVWLNGAGPTPSWQYTYPAGYQGVDCDVSDNGQYVAAICKESGSGTGGQLALFNANNSTPFWVVNFVAGNQANGVEISENNQWVAVACYSNFYVYNLSEQTLFFTGPNYSQTMCGLDDDAEWLAEGDFYGVLHVYRRIGNTYVEQWTNALGGWVTAVDISSDASTVMAGNFTYSPTNGGLVRAFNMDGTVRWSYNQYGDYVADVALCDDGSVGLAGSWGMLDATYGDVFTAFEMGNGTVILNLRDDLDEPGSIFDVAISDDGTLATCGGKAVHARTFGNGGETYSIELAAVIQNISVSVVPVNPPVIIPLEGGNFDFQATITNTGTTPQTFQGWTMVLMPSGNLYGPVLLPITLTLQGGQSLSKNRTQFVPGSAPPGGYSYIGYVGNYPSAIADSSSFPFVKLDSVDQGAEFSEWTNTGEEFAGVGAHSSAPMSGSGATPTMQVIPNPFNPSTVARYELRVASFVSLRIYDTAGRLVTELVNGWREAGTHQITFDGSHLPSGIYFTRLQAGSFTQTQKMILLK